MHTDLDFASLTTPQAHGGVLIEPGPLGLRHLTEQNREHLDALDIEVGGVSLAEVRRQTRRRIGLDDGLLVVTGHQPDFVHAGVWAKHVVAARLAAALEGAALNLVVDHDAPKQTALTVPDLADRRVRKIRYATWPSGAAFEFMPASDGDTCRQLIADSRAALGAQFDESLLPLFFEVYSSGTSGETWVDQAVASRRAVERAMGVAIEDRRTGRVWCGPLLCEMLCNAPRFAAAYNRALADYRRRHKVRSPDRPVPDLHSDGERTETALWVYHDGITRRRLFVAPRGDALELFADDEPLMTLDARTAGDWTALCPVLGQLEPWVIRPRALSLTLWARLVLADVFLHGIGGAKYDRATDDLIRNYFGVEPPGMACVSATLRFQPDAPDVTADLRRVRRRRRDLRFNPERQIDGEAIAALAAEKRSAVAESDRLRTAAPRDHRARHRVFERIRALNARMAETAPGLSADLSTTIDRLEQAAATARIAGDREYFFAMHPRQELERLLARIPAMEDFRGAAIV